MTKKVCKELFYQAACINKMHAGLLDSQVAQFISLKVKQGTYSITITFNYF